MHRDLIRVFYFVNHKVIEVAMLSFLMHTKMMHSDAQSARSLQYMFRAANHNTINNLHASNNTHKALYTLLTE